jgi:predicted  nucleic acid-binding Zn-ribbon protein
MFKCLECGTRYRTAKAAEKAARDGCRKCGGVDIDVDVDAPSEASQRQTTNTQEEDAQ